MWITKTAYTKQWLKQHPDPRMQQLFHTLKQIRGWELRFPALMNSLIRLLYLTVHHLLTSFMRVLVYTPAFRARTTSCGKQLWIYGGTPYVSGPLQLQIGHGCHISGQTTFSGRSQSLNPTLSVGNHVSIGWQTTIAVGTQVILEDNVMIAGRAFLCGYPGHPIDPEARARGEAETEDQIGKIHLMRNVWLATNVSVLHGVTIGEGTIVAAGSVVTHDLPAFVLAAGNPARVIKSLK